MFWWKLLEADELYGVDGGKAKYCAGHAQERMVNVSNKEKCAHLGCTKVPPFGVVGTKRREFCARRAKARIVNLAHNECAHPGCPKRPSFGMAGTKNAEFCT